MIIQAKEGRYNKIHISIDGEYLLTVDSDYWYSCGYINGDEIDEQELAEFKISAGSRRAFNAGADIISRREHSSKEVYQKLCRKFDPEVAEGAVRRLCEIGMIDDSRFAKMYADELYNKKGMGKRRILYELSAKGIDRDLAEQAVDEIVSDEEDNVQRIVDILEKKYYNVAYDEKQRRRAWSALQRLGYSYGDIRRAFSEFCESDFDSSEGW
ncbi:MAG: regulatory protein RecX [Clostridia bacterium]|nr:regulatory protein RecX [Clostridia bacterium]